MADDAVAKDFVGLKRVYQEYTFEAKMQEGSIIMGTGKWIGSSVDVHPDFAWFPYVIRSGNPEILYETVCQLTARQPVVTGQAETPPETPAATPSTPETPPETPTATVNEGHLTFEQLFVLINGQKSDFNFDIFASKHMGGKYIEGEKLILEGVSDRPGYLYVFGVNPDGKIALLYPQAGDDNHIVAKGQFMLPSSKSRYEWELGAPFGTHRIKAIVTEKPIAFTGMPVATTVPAMDFSGVEKVLLKLSELEIRTTPSEVASAQKRSKGAAGNISAISSSLQEILGYYAQDEIVIHVGKSRAGK